MNTTRPVTPVPKLDSCLFHPASPYLYGGHDTPRDLKDCPFPLKTDSFEVLIFGDASTQQYNQFAVVEFRKGCGHIAHERINFIEGVQDFDHHGTKFTGESYSIKSWESLIERFRQGLCPVCDIYEHCRWAHFHAGERTAPRKKTLARFNLLMDANFKNWREYVSESDFEKAIQSPENPALSLRKK